jgi:hypothetical protein
MKYVFSLFIIRIANVFHFRFVLQIAAYLKETKKNQKESLFGTSAHTRPGFLTNRRFGGVVHCGLGPWAGLERFLAGDLVKTDGNFPFS